MQHEVTLTVNHPAAAPSEHLLGSNRFTIGCDADNNLSIDDPGLSRRHALIERFDGITQISDCGSQNGTFLNGRMIAGPTRLSNGDIISLGDSLSIVVRIATAHKSGERTNIRKAAPLQPDSARALRLIAPSVVALVIVGIGLLIILSRSDDRGAVKRSEAVDIEDQVSAHANSASGENQTTPANAAAVSEAAVEAAAVQVVRRISTDEKKYTFPSAALNDIRRKVEDYKTAPALIAALRALADRGAAVALQARREGLPPAIALYGGLAEADGGRNNRDPVAEARNALPDFVWLKATFGTALADDSLILIAAYKLGRGTKKTHPLMAKLHKAPLDSRNIWYLHEHGLLEADSYEFVIKFLALGVIAQNPAQFGIAAPAPAF